MTARSGSIPAHRRLVFRAGLGALALVQVSNGLLALLAPRAFYDDFPFGRGWVATLPDYSEHLVRDVGGLFLATGIFLAAAAIWLERRLVAVALVSFLAFSLPHTVYHLFNLGPYGTADAVANVIALAATVLVPVALLALLVRDRKAAGPGAGAGGDRTEAELSPPRAGP